MGSEDRICQVCYEQVPDGEESCPNCGTYMGLADEGGEGIAVPEAEGDAVKLADDSPLPEQETEAELPVEPAPAEPDPAIEEEQPAHAMEQAEEAAASASLQPPDEPEPDTAPLPELKPEAETKAEAEPQVSQPAESAAAVPPKKKKRAPSKKKTSQTKPEEPKPAAVWKADEPEAKKTQPKPNQAKRTPSCVLIVILACAGLAYFGYMVLDGNNFSPGGNNNRPAITRTATSPVRPTRTPATLPLSPTPGGAASSPNSTDRVSSLDGCTTGDLRIRSGPSDTTETAGWVVEGVCLVFDGRDRDGVWVHIADGQETNSGWVVLRYVELEGDVSSLPLMTGSESQLGD